MRILLISNAYPSKEKKYSGIFVKNQFEELKLLVDGEVEIFAMRREFTSGFKSIIKYLKFYFSFTPYIFKKFDVIHLHFLSPLILLPAFYKLLHPKTKVVLTLHGSDINMLKKGMALNLYKRLKTCIDFTIAVGQEVAKNAIVKLNLNVDSILPVGVNNHVFYPNLKSKSIKQYDFIFVGSFLSVKGIDVLYSAIKKLPKNFSFCIVGKGEEYEKKLSLLREEGYNLSLFVDLNQEELRDMYSKSFFLVAPSRSEGFSTVVVEAMYSGIPVLASNITQFQEQINEGLNGYTFDVDDVDDLVEILQRMKSLDSDDYDELKIGALNSFKEISLNNVCLNLYQIYNRLIK